MNFENLLKFPRIFLRNFQEKLVSWCSWLSHESNTLRVAGSNPAEISLLFADFEGCGNIFCAIFAKGMIAIFLLPSSTFSAFRYFSWHSSLMFLTLKYI